MRGRASVIVALCCVVQLVGCDESRCGAEGREVTAADGGRYCVTESRAVIEGGISCPAELPFEVALEQGIVCTATETSAGDLPPEVCEPLGGCTPREPEPDRDAGADAAIEVPDGGTPHGRWTPMGATTVPQISRSCALLGTRLFVFGGETPAAIPSAFVKTNAAQVFDPDSGWTELVGPGRPSPRSNVALVGFDVGPGGWFVFGGDDGDGPLGDGAVYYGDAWRALPSPGAPSPRRDATAVWTGDEVLVWGGGPDPLGDGAAYDPLRDSWRPMSPAGAPAARTLHVSVWTGSELIVWGGRGEGSILSSGGAYDPSLDRWRELSSVGAPSARSWARAAWTGEVLIVWGGTASDGRRLSDGARYDPGTDTWRAMGDPPSSWLPSLFLDDIASGWNGAQFIVWGPRTAALSEVAGAAYDPTTDRWTPLALAGGPSARSYGCAVGSPNGLYVFGGLGSGRALLLDGAIHEP